MSTNVFVRRTPAEVFDFLADARNLALWSSGVSSVDSAYVPPGVDATYRYRYPGRHRPHRLVCSDFVPCRRIAFRGQRMWSPLGTQVPWYTFDLLPHADGTLVRLSVISSLSAALLLLGPLVAMAWRRDLPADGLKFRELLGGGAQAPAAVAPLAPTPAAGPVFGPAPAPVLGPVADPATVAALGAPEPGVPAAAPPRSAQSPHGFDYAH
jgi:uncharacterized protein YndB with AHSA1/START domain